MSRRAYARPQVRRSSVSSLNHIILMNSHELTLEGRLRAILRDVQDNMYSNEDAALRLRGEVLAGFFRGVEAQKKRPDERR